MIKGFALKVWLCSMLVTPIVLYLLAFPGGKPISMEGAVKFYILVLSAGIAFSMPSLLVFSIAVPHLKRLQVNSSVRAALAAAIMVLLIESTFQLLKAGWRIIFHHVTLSYILVTITAIALFRNDLKKG
jgi:chromate transport protein ChrA